MSREVEEMRRSFEEKLRTFSQAQNQFEQEKKVALEELKGQHRQEIQELLRSHQSQNANYSKDQEKLGQLHKAEVTQSLQRKWSHINKLNHWREKAGQRWLLTVCVQSEDSTCQVKSTQVQFASKCPCCCSRRILPPRQCYGVLFAVNVRCPTHGVMIHRRWILWQSGWRSWNRTKRDWWRSTRPNSARYKNVAKVMQ